MAGEEIGRAEIEVTADTTNFPRDVKRGVEESLEGVDPTLKKAGNDWGEELSQGTKESVKRKFPEVLAEVSSLLDKETIRSRVKVKTSTDVDHDTVRKTVRNIAEEVEKEVTSNSGIFGKIGQSIADAIGAGFNVSGKSPLIALLVPVVGGIAALILAAVQAVYELSAALFTLPTILAAIIAQAGVLFLVFKAVGPVISAVLSAQNAKELDAALKGVAPSIANFAKSLIPIKEFFDLLGKSAAVEFFKQLGDVVKDIFNANSREFFFGVIQVAGALGKFFNTIEKAFSSPIFVKFLKDLFDSIDHFLTRNGPYFEKFLEQVFLFLDKMIGPANDVGAIFSLLIIKFGDWFETLSKNPDFLDWLDRLPQMLIDVGDAIGAVLDLIGTLFKDIDEEGGADFLNQFTVAVKELNTILQTEAGKLAIKGLIDLIKLLGLVFFGLVVVIISVLAFIEKLGEWFKWLGDRVGDFLGWLNKLADKLGGAPQLIKDAFNTLIDQAPKWGARLIQGFIDGVLTKLGPLGNAMKTVAGLIGDHLPHSPAKVGPLSGAGSPFISGQKTVSEFAKGIMVASGQVNNAVNSAMSNVNFGTGAVIANFYGAQPTSEQANTLGTAVGNGIGDQLLARNARLAVRAM